MMKALLSLTSKSTNTLLEPIPFSTPTVAQSNIEKLFPADLLISTTPFITVFQFTFAVFKSIQTRLFFKPEPMAFKEFTW